MDSVPLVQTIGNLLLSVNVNNHFIKMIISLVEVSNLFLNIVKFVKANAFLVMDNPLIVFNVKHHA